MAHNIMMVNGKAAYAGRQAAWHNLGQVLHHAMTWQEAMEQAQLNWGVEKVQLVHPFTHEPISSYGMFRVNEEGEHIFLGNVGDVYQPIQNDQAFEFVDTLLQADTGNNAHYETAGALGNGEKIWCLARINGSINVAGIGDEHETYMLFTSSHDGSSAATCKLTTVRVVCQNTLNMAIAGAGNALKIRHTSDAARKMDAAKRLINSAEITIKGLEDKLNELARRRVTKDSVTVAMKKIFGDYESASTARISNKVSEVLDLFGKNDGNAFPQIKGTAYNLLNAVTEYQDHYSNFRRTDGKGDMTDTAIRSENALFGVSANLKESALDIILESTAGDPRHDITRTVYKSVDVPSTRGLLDDIIEASC